MLDCTDIAIIEEFAKSVLTSSKKVGLVVPGDFVGTPRKYTVIFASNFAGTSYGVFVNGSDQRSWTIENKTVSGFTINSNANQALTGNVSWSAFAVGE
jgi:hypothetical protein